MRVQSIDKLDCKVSENAVASASQGYAPPAAALRPSAPMWPTVGGPCATVFGIAANALMPQGLPKAVPKSRPSDRFLCVDRASNYLDLVSEARIPTSPLPPTVSPHIPPPTSAPAPVHSTFARPRAVQAPPTYPSAINFHPQPRTLWRPPLFTSPCPSYARPPTSPPLVPHPFPLHLHVHPRLPNPISHFLRLHLESHPPPSTFYAFSLPPRKLPSTFVGHNRKRS